MWVQIPLMLFFVLEKRKTSISTKKNAKVHFHFRMKMSYFMNLEKGDNMEIKVRNLDSNVVASIDDLARKQRKSRNEYLVEQLTLLAKHPQLREQEDKYRRLFDQMAAVIRENTEILNEILD